MRMPRVRFTVRGMMAAVAIVGALSGCLIERHTRFRRMAAQHANQKSRPWPSHTLGGDAEVDRYMLRMIGKYRWHDRLEPKYERAARYPWLPVAPDPPEPE